MIAVPLFLILACCGGGGGGNSNSQDPEPLKIGVLLPQSGEEDFGARQLLTWAAGEINNAGRVAGRAIALEFADPGAEGLDQAAARLANDDRVLAVIGPADSSDLDLVARRFSHRKKVLVSPSATSEDVFKSYAENKLIWRTVEADAAQLETMVSLAAADGAATAALVTSRDLYGLTFYHWFGFLAAEAGLTPVGKITYPENGAGCESYVDEATAARPDVLFAVALHTEQVACILRHARTVSPETRVIFSDGAFLPAALALLGQEAEGLEGMAPAPAPRSGFTEAYRARFQAEPPPFAANTWDALLLIVYGLAHSGGQGGELLADSMMAVVDGRGDQTGWDRGGIAAALAAIDRGLLPDISGASGPLDYDRELYTDPTSSYYAHWAVAGGGFVTRNVYLSGSARSDEQSAIRQAASDDLRTTFPGTGTPGPATPRRDLWALIVAGSRGWANYRHQADALAQYRYLRSNGVPDERIILVLADDLADNALNPRPGEVAYQQGGENLHVQVEVDYHLDQITAADLLDILSGQSSSLLPTVIQASADDNIYVFLSGHGSRDGFLVDPDNRFEVGAGTLLTPAALSATIGEMAAASAYRQMLLVVESCYSGLLGQALQAPNILVLTAASPYESSLAANRRLEDGTWLADQFAYQFWRAAVEDPEMSLVHVYEWTYKRVSGSHVSIYNAENFAGAPTVTLASFLSYPEL